MIFALDIGTPRTALCGEEGVEVEVEGELTVRSGLSGGGPESFLGIFGTFIFGIWNCAATSCGRNDAVAIAAISINDNLNMRFSPTVKKCISGNANKAYHSSIQVSGFS